MPPRLLGMTLALSSCSGSQVSCVPCAGEPPKGLRQANLTERTRPFLQEVALNEQVSGSPPAEASCYAAAGPSGSCKGNTCAVCRKAVTAVGLNIYTVDTMRFLKSQTCV